ncbi:hypothetical protein [Marinobacter changyiensis]|uniref:hypothetical protein n=1 Tax=Marinobacter changyiensis TaxID=2604091 RepID=UPI0012640CDB|nr:hypothetical protein [Marinobacter changyiensis]
MNPRKCIGSAHGPSCRPISFSIEHAAKALLVAGSIYAIIVLLALLLSRVGVEDQFCLALVHAAGATALLLFWKLGRWGNARYSAFGAALLLVGCGFRVHALLDALFYGARLENIYKYSNVPLPDPVFDLLLKGELITVAGLLIIACSWRLKVGRGVELYSFLFSARAVPLKISVLVYGVAFAVDVLRRVTGVSFGPLEQVASLFFVTGIASTYFIAARRQSAIGQVVLASLLALPLSTLALDSGMKEEIFFPFVPAGILYWINFRQLSARLFVICAAAIVLAISQLYVHNVRELSWRSTGDLDIPTTVLVASFVYNLQDAQLMDALDDISSRVNMTTAHAITVTLADQNGYEPGAVFGLIPASVVPRILWPGKPTMQPGAMHTARILGIPGPLSEISSSTAAGFATELYLGGWWIGVLLGAITFGWLLATAQQWAHRFGRGFGHQTLCFVALYWTLRFDEKHVVYAYTSILFVTIFIWMLVKTATVFGIRHTLTSR